MSKSMTKTSAIWCNLAVILVVGASVISRTEAEVLQEMEQRTIISKPSYEPVYVYASQSGKPTFDQGDSGGNPFASALIDTLQSENLTLKKFIRHVVTLTETLSQGRQRPDVQGASRLVSWRILPKPLGEKRVALVVVFSDYSASGGAQSLPGAARDLSRVSAAFEKAGFETQRVLDLDRVQLPIILREFASRSAASDVAVLYTTGHGVEVEGVMYLLPGDYPVGHGASSLNQRAIRLSQMGASTRAKLANLVFYGGCRNDPFN